MQRLGTTKKTSQVGVFLGVLTNARHKCCAFDPTLNDIDCMMWLAPLEFEFTPKEWCSFDDLEILKKAGKINIEEMWLIQLMHPEYQINNKNIGRKVLANDKICNKIAEEQHGLRKNHQAGLLLLSKILVGDLFLSYLFLRLLCNEWCKGILWSNW